MIKTGEVQGIVVSESGDGRCSSLGDRPFESGEVKGVAYANLGPTLRRPAVLIHGRTTDGRDVVLECSAKLFCDIAVRMYNRHMNGPVTEAPPPATMPAAHAESADSD